MARTLSNMMPLGTSAPQFSLTNVINDEPTHWTQVRGEKGTVVMFICAHCPYVIHVQGEIVKIAAAYSESGIGFVAISSNDIENYPQDAPDKLKEQAELMSFSFPYLYDADQSVAKAYEAACTPDFFVFDSEDKCAYRGRLDDSTPGNGQPLTGLDLRSALNQILVGQRPVEEQFPSMGCNIKWK